MGTQSTGIRDRLASGLGDALFSTTQQRVLGLLFGQPDRSFYANELIGLTGSGSGAVQRELARLEQTGLVTTHRLGTQKHYRANPESPLFAELCSIVRKTFGLAEPLRQSLSALASKITAAFVFGSVAKRHDTAASDIDLMIISDRVTYSEVFAAVESLGATLGRPVNPTVYTMKDLHKRLAQDNAFVKRVMDQPKIWLIGTENDIAA